MKLLDIASASIMGAAIGAGITFFLVNDRLVALEKDNEFRSPVAMVDFTSIAEGFPDGGNDSEISLEIKKLQVQTNKLVDEGFIVLNQNAVYAAPKGVTVRYRPSDSE